MLIYKGTIGSVLSHYIESRFNVRVLEYEPELEDLLSDESSDTFLAMVVAQEFPVELFFAVRQRAAGARVIWLCQDRNNQDCPDTLVTKYLCDGINEWLLFNNILNEHLASFGKKP